MVADIQLPHNWRPRPYQVKLWRYLAGGGRRAVARWHRRSGKDEVCLHHAASAAHEKVATYWHMLPQYGQARKAIWDAVNPHSGRRRIDEVFPHAIRQTTREQEMMIRFRNGSTWQLVGSDNFNSLVGSPPAGVTFSEYALADPAAWAYLRPILLENGGWALFISTPRGDNHFKRLCESAERDPEWFYECLTVDDTGIFTAGQLANELRELQAQHGEAYGKSLYLQEYHVSFDAAIPGAIWADCLDRARLEGRIQSRLDVKAAPVSTAWDLGFTDDTAIWFFQIAEGDIRVLDYHEDAGRSIEDYAEVLRRKAADRAWTYGTHWLPHDARPRTLAAGGKSILQQLLALKVGRCVIAPRLDREEGIQAGRATFPFCRFDETRCRDGLEKLRNYHREWDEEKRMFSMTPKHDRNSHAADAWRTLSLTWKHPRTSRPDEPLVERLTKGNPAGQTYGDLRQALFKKKALARQMAL
ncbi:MAG: hypothetical protein FJX68_12720 [Alphaproteobacteria bacterium]|nr:hypothetical protein [Alphaproteobacteria bacterium]